MPSQRDAVSRERPQSRRWARCWAGLALVFAFVASPAAAQAARIEQARELFEAGVAAADTGAWETAEGLFRRARALHASPALSFNHAAALAQLGRVLEASELLRAVVADPSAPRTVRTDSRALLASIEPRIGRLAVVVRGAAGSSIAVDGVELARSALGVPQPIDPGEHVVTSSRLGIDVARVVVVVRDGEVVWASIEVPAAVVARDPDEPSLAVSVPPAALAPSEPEHEDLAENGWVWLGVGLGVLAVAAAIAVPIGVATSSSGGPAPTCGSLGCWEIGR